MRCRSRTSDEASEGEHKGDEQRTMRHQNNGSGVTSWISTGVPRCNGVPTIGRYRLCQTRIQEAPAGVSRLTRCPAYTFPLPRLRRPKERVDDVHVPYAGFERDRDLIRIPRRRRGACLDAPRRNGHHLRQRTRTHGGNDFPDRDVRGAEDAPAEWIFSGHLTRYSDLNRCGAPASADENT